MKHIFVNLKRFDVPPEFGGVNRLCPPSDWGRFIVENTQRGLAALGERDAEFVHFFPEAHILSAVEALTRGSPLKIGCQGMYRMDTATGGNFGAFTTNLPASAARALGCDYVIIGHCEERADKEGILAEGGMVNPEAVDRILNKEIRLTLERDMRVLFCIGEKTEELPHWEETLNRQLVIGLEGVDTSRVVIGYEPVWSIGPGKTPAGKEHITKIARFVKEKTGGIDVVYGGGLKADNAKMIASIPEVDGGLIALTRFQGEIGFYPEEYLEIVRLYLGDQESRFP